jgi:hypothetical protein
MRLSMLVVVGVTVAVIASLGRATQAQQPETVTLAIDCRAIPETTSIRNDTSSTIVVQSILSSWEPGLRPGVTPTEVFLVNHAVPGGEIVTFFSGPGSPSPSLSQQFIYDDDQPLEGASVGTNMRALSVSCADGSVTVPLVPAGADVGPGGASLIQQVPPNSVRVAVSCATQPETVTVSNTLPSAITVQTVTSLSQPRPGAEPFVLNEAVPSNQVLTLQFGQGAAPGAVLVTGNSIFEENVPAEGVQLFTSVGSFTVLCSEGSVTRTSGRGRVVTPPSTGEGGLVLSRSHRRSTH